MAIAPEWLLAPKRLKSDRLLNINWKTIRPKPLFGCTATVFGSTGFLGAHVVTELARKGCQVVCPVRHFTSDFRFLRPMGEPGQVVPVVYDPTDLTDLRAVTSRSTIVINCIGKQYQPSLMRPKDLPFGYEAVYCNLPRRIAAVAAMGGAERFVHVSHINANEDHPTSRILRAKGKAERLVHDEFPTATIIRPTTMFGHNDHFTNYIATRLTRPWAIPVSRLDQQIQPAWVVNVARAVVRATTNVDYTGKTYALGGPEVFTLKDIVEWIALQTGREAQQVVETNGSISRELWFKARAKFNELGIGRNLDALSLEYLEMSKMDEVVNPSVATWKDLDIDVADLGKLDELGYTWLHWYQNNSWLSQALPYGV